MLLLPIFFALTGLRTEIGLVSGGQMWFYCGLILALAIIGKLFGSALAAWMSGLPSRDAIGLGVLMNTRGLMELVVLNLGLDLGIISPALFSMLVMMALVTTFMTTPLLMRLYPEAARRAPGVPAPSPGTNPAVALRMRMNPASGGCGGPQVRRSARSPARRQRRVRCR